MKRLSKLVAVFIFLTIWALAAITVGTVPSEIIYPMEECAEQGIYYYDE